MSAGFMGPLASGGLPPSIINKTNFIPQLAQVESTQSFKTSPVKSDAVASNKHYPQGVKKTATNKTQSNDVNLIIIL